MGSDSPELEREALLRAQAARRLLEQTYFQARVVLTMVVVWSLATVVFAVASLSEASLASMLMSALFGSLLPAQPASQACGASSPVR
jgi:hypothetical protein